MARKFHRGSVAGLPPSQDGEADEAEHDEQGECGENFLLQGGDGQGHGAEKRE